jgi:hypothetical protein
MLISKLPSNQAAIAVIYAVFLVLLAIMSRYSLELNLKIMTFKQKRINFLRSSDLILKEREQELRTINTLMVLDGIGLMLPFLVDVALIVLIYCIVGMTQQDRYFVLVTFGLARASISGLGTYMNMFAQSWGNLQRISYYLSHCGTGQTPGSDDELLRVIGDRSKKSSEFERMGKGAKLSDTLKMAERSVPFIRFKLALMVVLVFGSNFMYGFCAKSIIEGESVFSLFNLTSLLLQLLSPILLYWFICSCNLKMSKSVYQPLTNGHQTTLTSFTTEDINRLSGDIRMLDRQLYFAAYGTIFRFSVLYSSFFYSAVTFNNFLYSILFVSILVGLSIWLVWVFGKFVGVRKECYGK